MQLADWLRRGLEKPGKKANVLANLLGVPPSTVTKMGKGGRAIKETEQKTIAEYIEEVVPPIDGQPDDKSSRVTLGAAPEVWVRPSVLLAPSVWREPDMTYQGNDLAPLSPERKYAGFPQYVAKVDADKRCYICVPFDTIRQMPLDGDCVHVRRHRSDGLVEDTLQHVKSDGRTTTLLLDGDADKQLPYPAGNERYEIVGLAIGIYQSLA